MSEKENQIEITVKLNGESVPLSSVSDETIASIKRGEEQLQEKNAPVFSKIAGRLIVKMTPAVINTIRLTLRELNDGLFGLEENSFMSFDKTGEIGSFHLGSTWAKTRKFYQGEDPEPIFSD